MGDFLRAIILPAAMIAIAALAVNRRRLSWRDDLAVRRPDGRQLALWLTLWAAWVTTVELAGPQLGLDAPWGAFADLPASAIALRAVGIVLLAPIGEELVFRGLLFRFVSGTRLGIAGAVLVPAVLFAAMHLQYLGLEMVVVFIDAVLLGLARWRSASVLVPIAMHMAGNLFAFIQRVLPPDAG